MPHRLPKPPADLVQFLRSSERILITSHANPDGDAIGSEAGLAEVLSSLGKSVTVWNRDPAPSVYSNLLDPFEIVVGESPPASFPDAFDAVFLVECPTLDRTGHDPAHFDGLHLINVDHHLGNSDYGRFNWVRPEMPSVSVLIFQLACALGAEPTEQACDALYLGLATDTGGFRFSNTTAQAHAAAAALVEAGASPERVSKQLYESRPEGALRLLAEVLRTLERSEDGRVATVELDQAMLERTGATRQDGESLIDYPRSIVGVEVVAMFRELAPESYKVSLRSRGPVSVEAVARRHGGGGHRNAAGCELNGPLSTLKPALVRELLQALGQSAEESVESMSSKASFEEERW